jgi:methylphosphotriester-DNA--protein-cysteine methyltransferase
MIILRTPAELAASLRKVAAGLPPHQIAEARDLEQAAQLLEPLYKPVTPPWAASGPGAKQP